MHPFSIHGGNPLNPREIWTSQCDAARQIREDFGTEKAVGYLVGEKLLNYLEVAETDAEWRAELPDFIEEIKDIFEAWEIAEFLETPRRLGVLGHVASEESHELFRSQADESDQVREDARNLMMLEWARELLLGEEKS